MKSLTQRFWPKVKKTNYCWIWLGARNPGGGYGRFLGATGRWELAHRVSWEIHNGPIPEGMWVLHHCDNPKRVNPEHLFIGTHADNMHDKMVKLRFKHKLPKDYVNIIRGLSKVGIYTSRDLGEAFGVDHKTVLRIVNGLSWVEH